MWQVISVFIHLFRRFTESFHNFYEAGQMLLGPLWDPKHDQWTAQWPARPHRKGTDPKSMDLARIRKIQKNLRVYKTIQLHCNHEVSLKLWKIFKLRCSKARLGLGCIGALLGCLFGSFGLFGVHLESRVRVDWLFLVACIISEFTKCR